MSQRQRASACFPFALFVNSATIECEAYCEETTHWTTLSKGTCHFLDGRRYLVNIIIVLVAFLAVLLPSRIHFFPEKTLGSTISLSLSDSLDGMGDYFSWIDWWLVFAFILLNAFSTAFYGTLFDQPFTYCLDSVLYNAISMCFTFTAYYSIFMCNTYSPPSL